MNGSYLIAFAAAAIAAGTASEPAARRLTAVPLRIDTPIAHVSAVRELSDGRLFVTDMLHPALYLVVPSTGAVTRIGSVGGARGQYVAPGGLYPGVGDSTIMIDRAQTTAVSISSAGVIGGSRSTAQRGVQTSSSADVDWQRLDAKGLVYFANRFGHLMAERNDSVALLRLDAVAQHADTLARLKRQDSRITSAGDGMQFSRVVVGSPADDWAVAPDGRVAVVRAAPYRVDWIGIDGHMTRGPVIPYDVVPMTDAEKAAVEAANKKHAARGGSGPSVGATHGGSTVSGSDLGESFAATKAPFDVGGVSMSPAGRVWVKRNRALDATRVVYDVFDADGQRIDRVELPPESRVVGFGNGAVYVAIADERGVDAFKKFKL